MAGREQLRPQRSQKHDAVELKGMQEHSAAVPPSARACTQRHEDGNCTDHFHRRTCAGAANCIPSPCTRVPENTILRARLRRNRVLVPKDRIAQVDRRYCEARAARLDATTPSAADKLNGPATRHAYRKSHGGIAKLNAVGLAKTVG